MLRFGQSRAWAVTIAFFLGAAASAIAYDLTDYAFYSASSKGSLSADQQAIWFTWFPFLYYIGFATISYLLARVGWIKASSVLYFYLFLVVIGYLLGLQLPQAQSIFWTLTATAGLFVAGGIALGVVRHLGRRHGLSKVNGAFLLLFALIMFILLTIVPTMSILGSTPTSPAQISSSPLFFVGVLTLLGITGYVLVKWRRTH